jgi:hypothetical protein
MFGVQYTFSEPLVLGLVVRQVTEELLDSFFSCGLLNCVCRPDQKLLFTNLRSRGNNRTTSPEILSYAFLSQLASFIFE